MDKKKSCPKKPPAIKHTKTSLYRMIKANPLLLWDKTTHTARKDIGELDLPDSVLGGLCYTKLSISDLSQVSNKQDVEKANIAPQMSANATSSKVTDVKKEAAGNMLSKFQCNNKVFQASDKVLGGLCYTKLSISDLSQVSNKQDVEKAKTAPLRYANATSSKIPDVKKEAAGNMLSKFQSNNKTKDKVKPKVQTKCKPPESYYKRFLKTTDKAKQVLPNKTLSGIQSVETKMKNVSSFKQLNPEIGSVQKPIFKTPSAYNRRSVKFASPSSNRKIIYNATLGVNDLQQKLNNWLQKEEKSVTSCHHLNQFGAELNDEENKENMEPYPPLLSSSYEELNTTYTCEENNIDLPDLTKIAKEALVDLHKLILDGYSKEQCEMWLEIMKEKCQAIVNDAEYWECKAAIAHCSGNVNVAVECYKHATDKAVKKENSEHIEQLFNKFNLLNIDADVLRNDEFLQAENIKVDQTVNSAKGSVLQFAVHEFDTKRKPIKDLDNQKFYATPVKRSSRLSRSAYVNTPDVKLCSSLKELTPEVREKLCFIKNRALLD